MRRDERMKKKTILVLPGIENLATVSNEFTSDYNVTGGRFCDLVFQFVNSDLRIYFRGKDLRAFSYVWISSYWDDRDMAYGVSLYLRKHGVPHSFVEKAGSKIVDQILFTQAGIPIPDTCFSTKLSSDTVSGLVEETCGFPAIIKDIYGARGRYSKMVERMDGFESVVKKLHPCRRFMFQRFIPNEYDWGILVVDGVVQSAEKSYRAEGEFRNNACRRATEQFVPVSEVPDRVKWIAVKAAEVLGLSWSRSDIIVHKDTEEPLLLEVNRFPGTTFGSGEINAATTFLRTRIGESAKLTGDTKLHEITARS